MNTVLLNTVHLDGAPIVKKGSGEGGGVTINNQSKSVDITENGSVSVTPDAGYTGLSKVDVNVDVPTQEINNQEKAIDIVENGTTEIVADSGYTGLGKVSVNVNVPSSGGDTPTPDMPVIGDGKTYLYIKIAEEGRMTVPLYFSQTVANGVTIDWGDGSATQTLSDTGKVNITHTYTETGDYTISLNPSSGCTLSLGHNSSSYCVMGSTGDGGRVYCNMLQAVEIGNGVTSIGISAFSNCYSLASVVIPDSVTSIGVAAFASCYSLTSIVIPDSITTLEGSVFSSCYSLANIVIPQGITSIGNSAFHDCHSLASIVIPYSVTSIGNNAFDNCYSLSSIIIPDSVTSIGDSAFTHCYGMAYYDFSQHTSIPAISSTTFRSIPFDCKIFVPQTLYNDWVKATNWSELASHIISDYTPTECVNLEITAKDVSGRATSTNVSYTAITNGVNRKGERITNITITGDAKSNDFPQNTSTTDTIERTISYTYLGFTATTTITQGVWVDTEYTVDLNGGQWAISDTVANPDAETYDGVYQSVLSKGVNNGFDTMYVDIDGYSAFKLYIRSYSESGYDFVMVSQLDKTIIGSTSSSNSTLVKATTQNASNPDTSINGYTLVEFTGIDEGAHRITIVYRKDSSGNQDDDRGYVLIPKKQ